MRPGLLADLYVNDSHKVSWDNYPTPKTRNLVLRHFALFQALPGMRSLCIRGCVSGAWRVVLSYDEKKVLTCRDASLLSFIDSIEDM